jgi:hypothetical protein
MSVFLVRLELSSIKGLSCRGFSFLSIDFILLFGLHQIRSLRGRDRIGVLVAYQRGDGTGHLLATGCVSKSSLLCFWAKDSDVSRISEEFACF